MSYLISAVSSAASTAGGFTSGLIIEVISYTGGMIVGRVITHKKYFGVDSSGTVGGTGTTVLLLNNLNNLGDSLFSTSLKVGATATATCFISSAFLESDDRPETPTGKWSFEARVAGAGAAALGTVAIGPITGLCMGVLTTTYFGKFVERVKASIKAYNARQVAVKRD